MADKTSTGTIEAELIANEKAPGAALAKCVEGGDFCPQHWANSAIARIQATEDDTFRLSIKDEAVRVAAFAVAVGNRDAEVLAQEIVQRIHRAIGKAHPRQSGGRPASAAGEAENLSTDEKVLPPTTVHRYRADAEALTDGGFEALASAARDAGQPLNRATLHRAGRLETKGRDPADAVRQQPAAHARQDSPVADPPPAGSSGPLVRADATAVDLRVCAVEALCDEVEQDSIDAVAVELPRVGRTFLVNVLDFVEYAARSGGLALVQCPVHAVSKVVTIWDEPDGLGNQWVVYESLVACVVTEIKTGWFPVLVFRRSGGDADLARRRPTLFLAGTGADAWRQVLAAHVPAGSAVWDPCCGSGEVLVGAAAAGMRITGTDGDAANTATTRAALEEAAHHAADAAAP